MRNAEWSQWSPAHGDGCSRAEIQVRRCRITLRECRKICLPDARRGALSGSFRRGLFGLRPARGFCGALWNSDLCSARGCSGHSTLLIEQPQSRERFPTGWFFRAGGGERSRAGFALNRLCGCLHGARLVLRLFYDLRTRALLSGLSPRWLRTGGLGFLRRPGRDAALFLEKLQPSKRITAVTRGLVVPCIALWRFHRWISPTHPASRQLSTAMISRQIMHRSMRRTRRIVNGNLCATRAGAPVAHVRDASS